MCSTQGQVFHLKCRNQVAVVSEDRPSTANSGTKVAILLGINRYSSFPLLFVPHCLFSIWTYLKRFEKISGAPTWRWGEWIWLTGPSGFHRNSPQGLNISSIRVSDQIRDPEILHFSPVIYVNGFRITFRNIQLSIHFFRQHEAMWLSRFYT